MLSDAVRHYHTIYAQQENPPLYAAPWWLDLTCAHGQWDALIIPDEDAEAISCLPFHKTRIKGLAAITTPPLTQWVSVLSDQKKTGRLDFDWFGGLPKYSILDLSIKNLAEWHVPQYPVQISTRYSYVLPFTTSYTDIQNGYNEGLRRNLKQAEQLFHVSQDDQIPAFIHLVHATYQQRKMKSPWWVIDLLPSLCKELLHRNSGRLYFIHHQQIPVAAIFVAWDSRMMYYLAGGRSETGEGISAHSLLMDYAIRDAQRANLSFDFEGSMVPGIANFFQSFGARPSAYPRIRDFRGWGKWWALWH
jgi:hypothetical protein